VEQPRIPVPNGQADGPTGERLEGWKAIASYLRRDIRTVQRWELHEGLPIHRLGHQQRASAVAFTGELDEWMARRLSSRPVEPGPDGGTASRLRGWRIPAAALAVAVGVMLIAAAVRSIRPDRDGRGDTQNPQAYAAFAEGSALYASRQYRDAVIALERAVSLDPSYALAWAWLGKTYGRLSQPMWAGGGASSHRAAEAAERASILAPDLSEAHVALALAARSTSEVKQWRAAARRALELDARAAEAMALLGDSYSAYPYACGRDEDPALAESYYRRALELRPDLITAASNRAHNLRRMERLAECESLMNRLIRAFPDETPLLAERGACRLLAGDVAGATQDIAPLRHNPKIAPAGALVYLGMLELRTGRTDDGVRDLESVFRLDQSARAELVVAETYGLAGAVEHASTHLRRAFDLDPACVRTVDTGRAFAHIRHADDVEELLARYRTARGR
jgi:tetratricopeptide (TPR) repeat protein